MERWGRGCAVLEVVTVTNRFERGRGGGER